MFSVVAKRKKTHSRWKDSGRMLLRLGNTLISRNRLADRYSKPQKQNEASYTATITGELNTSLDSLPLSAERYYILQF
uniref:Uncharacterized protein n=1 Tax=Angiostrongylus cantonensis TaxID=6313 RepID=A0A0K0D8Z1_ANGCA